MGRTIGGLIIVFSWVAGIGFWVYALTFWSILQLYAGLTATPMNGKAIFWGILWFFLSKIIAGAIVWVGTLLGKIVSKA